MGTADLQRRRALQQEIDVVQKQLDFLQACVVQHDLMLSEYLNGEPAYLTVDLDAESSGRHHRRPVLAACHNPANSTPALSRLDRPTL